MIASEKPLGWVAEGEIPTVVAPCLLQHMSTDMHMESLVQSYIDGEHSGLKPNDEIVFESDEAQMARALMTKNSFRRDDGRYGAG